MARRPLDLEAAFADARGGARGPLAKLLSVVERGGDPARRLGQLVHPHTGSGYTIGLTGAPGAGKSTLTSAMVADLRARDLPATVLAIDPSSPFSGGAILGDRVRMVDHSLDPEVFIRSMATRGHLGGLSLAAPAAIRLLEAVGREWILVETVGVGQIEVDIAGDADTTVVVVNPGWGDAIQANKAGLMEIADVFVVNKSDRDGADATRRDLEYMLDLGSRGDWRPPVVMAVGTEGTGITELWSAIADHRSHLEQSGDLARRRAERSANELERILSEQIRARVDRVREGDGYAAVLDRIRARELDPWTAADQLLG